MMYTNYALPGLRRTKRQEIMMKIQVNHIMQWEVKTQGRIQDFKKVSQNF